jgi:hypothetical protein
MDVPLTQPPQTEAGYFTCTVTFVGLVTMS